VIFNIEMNTNRTEKIEILVFIITILKFDTAKFYKIETERKDVYQGFSVM
jgi:hypothetical protein